MKSATHPERIGQTRELGKLFENVKNLRSMSQMVTEEP